MNNIDKIQIETEEEQQAFGAIVANRLIDTTPNQVEQLTDCKPKAVQRLAIDLDAAEMAKFGDNVVATTCGEILKALNAGIGRQELVETLQSIINSSRKAAGVSNEISE